MLSDDLCDGVDDRGAGGRVGHRTERQEVTRFGAPMLDRRWLGADQGVEVHARERADYVVLPADQNAPPLGAVPASPGAEECERAAAEVRPTRQLDDDGVVA